MTASYLPSILVPIIGIVFPGLSMALLFIYIEQETIS
nr:photosystem I subunit VIII [Lithothamnion corallioides]WEA77019.1 photosystem I subunit VIII [Lithothamnion corallioides]